LTITSPPGRLVLHDDGRIARNVIDDVARDRAREQVVAAACAGAHQHAQLLAPIERRHVLLRARWRA